MWFKCIVSKNIQYITRRTDSNPHRLTKGCVSWLFVRRWGVAVHFTSDIYSLISLLLQIYRGCVGRLKYGQAFCPLPSPQTETISPEFLIIWILSNCIIETVRQKNSLNIRLAPVSAGLVWVLFNVKLYIFGCGLGPKKDWLMLATKKSSTSRDTVLDNGSKCSYSK